MPGLRRTSIAVTASLAALATGGFTLQPAAAGGESGSSEGTARVFMVNPVQSSNDQSLSDHKDAASDIPASAYTEVPLTHLDGSGYLRGDYAVVESSTGKPAHSTTNTYSYTRDQDQFEQVMGYFWVTRAQSYLHDLGYGSSLDAGAIGESFGDYFAVSVGLDAADEFGWPVAAEESCPMDWDSTSYTDAPHCIRSFHLDLTLEDRRNQVHYDGQIWSQALWEIREGYQAMGLSTRDWDTTLIYSQFSYAPDTSFQDAAAETYAAAVARDGQAAAELVRDRLPPEGSSSRRCSLPRPPGRTRCGRGSVRMTLPGVK